MTLISMQHCPKEFWCAEILSLILRKKRRVMEDPGHFLGAVDDSLSCSPCYVDSAKTILL
jgi:hypothetical protein